MTSEKIKELEESVSIIMVVTSRIIEAYMCA